MAHQAEKAASFGGAVRQECLTYGISSSGGGRLRGELAFDIRHDKPLAIIASP